METLTTTGKAAWLIAIVLLAALTIVAVRRPVAHCHDGSCHAHEVR